MLYKDLVLQVVKKRLQSDISQKEMAKKVNCTPVSMNHYENGKREMPGFIFVKYAEILGFELRLLIK